MVQSPVLGRDRRYTRRARSVLVACILLVPITIAGPFRAGGLHPAAAARQSQTAVAVNCSSGAVPATVNAGGSESLSASVTAVQTITNGMVSFEIYNSGGSKVGDPYLSGQTLTANVPHPVSATWTVPAAIAAGTYMIKVLVFGPSWSPLYSSTWACSTFAVAAAPTTTATPIPPTATMTRTAVPPSATPTNTAVPPTATFTATAIPPSATPTKTAVPPTATFTATAVPQPTSTNPSGQSMPVGDVPGWHQIFADDFTTTVPVGSFPGTAYGNKWSVYSNGTSDTSGNGQYYPSKVLSVANGMLNIYLHTENGIHMVAAALPKLPTMTYGRYSVRFRADTLYGYKTAWLLWPDSNPTTGGEVDFPESCTGLDGVICAFLHYANSSGRDYYGTGTGYGSWHTATIEWSPGKCTFIFDGQTLGTSTNGVPTNPMHWVLQTETATYGESAPSSTESGNVQVDWVVAYTWTGA